ncbi:MAG: hypothetical protein EOP84_16545 [Verrucomicrobiaceae bacterium]|nr:MAG: hypothetical protein EOP84_16545 [Verrucomicrobiaceae bacterium]
MDNGRAFGCWFGVYPTPCAEVPDIICHAWGMSGDLPAISQDAPAIFEDPPSIREDSLRIYRDPCGISDQRERMCVDLWHIIPDARRIS